MSAPKLRRVPPLNALPPAEAAREAEDRLARTLALAFLPSELDPELNERLIASALSPPLAAEAVSPLAAEAVSPLAAEAVSPLAAEAGPREVADATLLRAALDGESTLTEHRALVGELVAAWRPAALASVANEALIHRHTRRASVLRLVARPALALAAAAALVVAAWGPELRSRTGAPRAPAIELSLARSAAELFDPAEAFAQMGGESARIDLIGAARAAEFRANRFARWGLR